MIARSPDDQPFHHYTTRHRIVAWISQRLFDNFTYTVRRGLNKGLKRKGGLAWLPEFLTRSGKTAEEIFWQNLDLTGRVVYDIGAFHGLLTMFFAGKSRQVISYEPNTGNRKRLLHNLGLNGVKNVVVRQAALGAKSEVATLVASTLMPGGASIQRDTVAGIVKSNQPVLSEQVSVTTLDDDIRAAALPAPDLVKIDVEGGELAVLQGARHTLLECHPRLFLEMHGETMNLKRQNVAAIVAFLHELGYSQIRHIESGAAITVANSALAAEGHLYCQ